MKKRAKKAFPASPNPEMPQSLKMRVASRYERMAALARSLQGDGSTVPYHSPSNDFPTPPLPPKPPAQQLGWWAGSLSLLLLLALLLFFWQKNNKDTDGDGVADHEDSCAQVFGDTTNSGCPLPDDDADGLPNKHDKCPFVPGVKAQGGCPEGCPTGTYTETVNGATFKMIAIPGGTFTMGDLYGEGEDDETRHRVTLSAYHLGETEVTQRLYFAVMGSTPSYFGFCFDCPIERVSWEDAQSFIRQLNAMTTRKYRLPTEAEWEYAAREGGRKVRFGNGKEIADPQEMNFDARMGYQEPYSVMGLDRRRISPTKTFAPNNLGLYDMAGNMWEWCADGYGPYGGAATNPELSNEISRRVIRGGAWCVRPQGCRAANREFDAPSNGHHFNGFRLASQ